MPVVVGVRVSVPEIVCVGVCEAVPEELCVTEGVTWLVTEGVAAELPV